MSRLVLKIGGARRRRPRRLASRTISRPKATRSSSSTAPARRSRPRWSERGLDVAFVDGRRVTTAAALEVVRESLAEVNADALRRDRPARRRPHGRRDRPRSDPGSRARPRRGSSAESPRARSRRASRRVGSRSSLPSAKGPLNVNADEAAVALAAGLGAERILFVTDVPGVLLDGDVIASIGADEADRLLDDGHVPGRDRAEAPRGRARGPPRRCGPRSARRR